MLGKHFFNWRMEMYKIKINDTVVAVSPDMLKAMNSVFKLVANFAGIKNENFVACKGIDYMPWGNCAHATCMVNNEIFEVWISKIEVV